MALLACPRCYRHVGGAAQESVNEAAEAEQVLQRADELKAGRRACGGREVRPLGGDQRLASVRQNENELQAATHVRVPKDLQRLSLKRMMRTGDGHSLREVLTVGSVWWFPSTNSSTTGWFGL
jgi:hypothetical protein